MASGKKPTGHFPVPQSGVAGVEWPAVPTDKNATLMGLLYQLHDSQWWPLDVLESHQFKQLAPLVHHARETVPFYGDRLDVLGRGGGITWEDWRRVPVLTREELQTHSDSLLSSDIPKDHGGTDDHQSSGSTGRPVSVRATDLHGLFFAALNIRHYQWQDLTFTDSVAAIRPLRTSEAELSRQNKGIPWVAGHASGPMYLFDVALPVSQQVAWLAERGVSYLLTMPSNLQAMLDYMEAEDISLPTIRKVMTMSEIITPELRKKDREVLAPIGDSYSAHEAGMMALQCPEHDHYHVQSESLLIEILNDDDEPCDVGEVGRVVMTDLHNFAMPLIRYDIGDFAEVGEACPCGRGLPVVSRIWGRKRNMVVFPSGDTAWPVPWLSSDLIPIAPILQLQMTQHTVEKMELKLVTERPLTTDEEAALTALFQKGLHHPFEIEFVYVDGIERSKGGKFEDFISLVET